MFIPSAISGLSGVLQNTGGSKQEHPDPDQPQVDQSEPVADDLVLGGNQAPPCSRG